MVVVSLEHFHTSLFKNSSLILMGCLICVRKNVWFPGGYRYIWGQLGSVDEEKMINSGSEFMCTKKGQTTFEYRWRSDLFWTENQGGLPGRRDLHGVVLQT